MTIADQLRAHDLRAAFYRLENPEDVAELLQVSYSHLTFMLYGKNLSQRYTVLSIRKKSGGTRTIHAPCPALKVLQQRLHEVFQAVYTPKASVHGFVGQRSVVSNAKSHVGQRFVLNVDLKDFFPSIHFGRVRGLFMAAPYNRNHRVATVLAQLCCYGDPSALPQGAPTSPIVSNMICAKMDTALRRLAKDYRCVYSRYADDITFSTNQPRFPRQLASQSAGRTEVGRALHSLIEDNWFSINTDKVRLQTQYERQEVTGLTVNEKMNVRRRYVRQIKAMLHAWQTHGFDAAAEEHAAHYDHKHRAHGLTPDFAEVVLGKLHFLAMVKGRSDPVYENLVKWGRTVERTLFERLPIVEDSVWVISDVLFDTQGTAFALENVGWITCDHAFAPNIDIHRPDVGYARFSPVPIRRSRTHDLCVFHAPVKAPHALKPGNPEALSPGDRVTILGYPAWGDGKSIQRTVGRITGTNTFLGVKRYNVDVAIVPGNSGGPVLNDRGQVIGIAAKGSYTGTSQSEFIPITAISRLLALPNGWEDREDAFVAE